MVAITVILAAVIASFVFGFGSKMGTAAPNAQFVVKDDPDELSGRSTYNYLFDIEHAGGDSIPCNDMRIYVYDAATGNLVEILDWSGSRFADTGDPDGTVNLRSNGDIGLTDGIFGPGDVIKIRESGSNVNPGTYEVKIMYVPGQTFIFDAMVTIK